jgi:hypothetical protein
MRSSFLLLACLLLSACGGPSASQLAEQHRAAASAKLAKIAALAPLVAAQPRLTGVEWKLPANLRLDFTPFADQYAADGTRLPSPTYNTAIAYEQHLAKPSEAQNLTWESHSQDLFLLMVDRSESWLIEPACLLESGRGRYGSDPVVENLKSDLVWLEQTKFLLVLRLATRKPPGLVLSELEAGEMKTFQGGQVAGDALLFDIESGACLGGFAIDVRSGSEIEVSNSRVHTQLQLALSGDVDRRIREELAKVGEPPR